MNFVPAKKGDKFPAFQPNLGKRIKQLRNARGMTQEGLAEAVNVNSSFIGLLESGRRLPSLAMLAEIAEALNVPAHHVLMDPSEVEPKQQTLEELIHLLNKRPERDAKFLLKMGEELSKNYPHNR